MVGIRAKAFSIKPLAKVSARTVLFIVLFWVITCLHSGRCKVGGGAAFARSRNFPGDAPIALDSLEEVFYPVSTLVGCCGEWYGRGAVAANRKQVFVPLASATCLRVELS